ncbi:MAG TPA: hypothetical protein VJ501_15545, partial [Burkholderiaceae bacterium]|nr:hypothetical protein [Burkholderiaceae bacterium]
GVAPYRLLLRLDMLQVIEGNQGGVIDPLEQPTVDTEKMPLAPAKCDRPRELDPPGRRQQGFDTL